MLIKLAFSSSTVKFEITVDHSLSHQLNLKSIRGKSTFLGVYCRFSSTFFFFFLISRFQMTFICPLAEYSSFIWQVGICHLVALVSFLLSFFPPFFVSFFLLMPLGLGSEEGDRLLFVILTSADFGWCCISWFLRAVQVDASI